jgi:hypothetical protein
VRSEAIVLLAPVLNLLLRIRQPQEPMYVQALLAEAVVKRFNVRIIGWFARTVKVERHVLVIGPAVERFADKLPAIIHLDALRHHT